MSEEKRYKVKYNTSYGISHSKGQNGLNTKQSKKIQEKVSNDVFDPKMKEGYISPFQTTNSHFFGNQNELSEKAKEFNKERERYLLTPEVIPSKNDVSKMDLEQLKMPESTINETYSNHEIKKNEKLKSMQNDIFKTFNNYANDINDRFRTMNDLEHSKDFDYSSYTHKTTKEVLEPRKTKSKNDYEDKKYMFFDEQLRGYGKCKNEVDEGKKVNKTKILLPEDTKQPFLYLNKAKTVDIESTTFSTFKNQPKVVPKMEINEEVKPANFPTTYCSSFSKKNNIEQITNKKFNRKNILRKQFK